MKVNKQPYKQPYNNKGQKHGYWVVYFGSEIWCKGLYINGIKNGYWVYYNTYKTYIIL